MVCTKLWRDLTIIFHIKATDILVDLDYKLIDTLCNQSLTCYQNRLVVVRECIRTVPAHWYMAVIWWVVLYATPCGNKNRIDVLMFAAVYGGVSPSPVLFILQLSFGDFYLPKFQDIVQSKFWKSWTFRNFRTFPVYIDVNFICLWCTSQNVLL